MWYTDMACNITTKANLFAVTLTTTSEQFCPSPSLYNILTRWTPFVLLAGNMAAHPLYVCLVTNPVINESTQKACFVKPEFLVQEKEGQYI